MFNDFKNLVYSVTSHKFRILKDIFDRLSLDDFEYRLLELYTQIAFLNKKISEYEIPIVEEIVEEQDLPDLRFSGFTATNYLYYVNFAIRIINSGVLPSSPTILREMLLPSNQIDIPIPALEPDEVYDLNIQYDYDPNEDDLDTVLISHVNPNKNFVESNYKNNLMSSDVTIKGPYPFVPGGPAYVIIHIHNQEGYELGGVIKFTKHPTHPQYGTPPFFFTYQGPTYSIDHARRQNFSNPGPYIAEATYNGMTINLGLITINQGETKSVTAIFERSYVDLASILTHNDEQTRVLSSGSQQYVGTGVLQFEESNTISRLDNNTTIPISNHYKYDITPSNFSLEMETTYNIPLGRTLKDLRTIFQVDNVYGTPPIKNIYLQLPTFCTNWMSTQPIRSQQIAGTNKYPNFQVAEDGIPLSGLPWYYLTMTDVNPGVSADLGLPSSKIYKQLYIRGIPQPNYIINFLLNFIWTIFGLPISTNQSLSPRLRLCSVSMRGFGF